MPPGARCGTRPPLALKPPNSAPPIAPIAVPMPGKIAVPSDAPAAAPLRAFEAPLAPPPPLPVVVTFFACDGCPGTGGGPTTLTDRSGLRFRVVVLMPSLVPPPSGTPNPPGSDTAPSGSAKPIMLPVSIGMLNGSSGTLPPGARWIAPPRAANPDVVSRKPLPAAPAPVSKLLVLSTNPLPALAVPLPNVLGNAPFLPNRLPASPAVPSAAPPICENGDGPGAAVEAVPPAAFANCDVRPDSHADVWNGYDCCARNC